MLISENKIYVGLGGGSLTQISERKSILMMSYLAKSSDGKIIMIDGGFDGDGIDDTKHLYNLLQENGGKVDCWIITHPHSDHYMALYKLITEPEYDIQISEIRFNFPPIEWLKTVEKGENFEYVSTFLSAIKKHNLNIQPLNKNDVYSFGDIKIEVLNDCSNYKQFKSINDTSIIFKMFFPKREVLFLGDLAVDGQNDFINNCDISKIKCDIVQMAHHGQQGVNKEFYKLIQPKICLYPSAKWIWDNDIGEGFNTGPLKTVETRSWMEELKVQLSCPSAFGDYILI